MQVKNITRYPLPISSTVKNLTPLEEIKTSSDASRLDASAWFKITEPDFILQPGVSKTITIKLAPPVDATPGGHYATIYFQPVIPDSVLTSETAFLAARVGVLSFLIVRGDIKQELAIDSFTPPGLKQTGPITFNVALKNTGNVHTLPTGAVTIRNWRKK